MIDLVSVDENLYDMVTPVFGDLVRTVGVDPERVLLFRPESRCARILLT